MMMTVCLGKDGPRDERIIEVFKVDKVTGGYRLALHALRYGRN